MPSTQLSRTQTHTPTGPDEQERKEKGVDNTGVRVPVLEASDSDEQTLSRARKLVVLSVLSSAQFFDIFIGNAVVGLLPSLAKDLHFTPGALQWILSAYTLTFASFMLIAGSLSDIFHPKQNPYSASASPLSPYSASRWGQASSP
ncbi:hypothetical protein PLEOSDRAFT_158868 [Pleurotus ostreatus PC15]|uniref:Major facilitator superfamily (MFS) profile domain-containing protein n=1 Tax=Pleurotus ostreatus (strain PC15) TaxID=1137138 RepID=A0A067NUG0_PLEO1|nr:hypothetical protein PLEOSDRAFT_158868 [Pleurotus ostreatus PC15]